MKIIIKEDQLLKLIKEIKFDPEVKKIQQDLVNKGYDLGKYGPKGDGVDGKAGPLTKSAYEKEYGRKLLINKKENDSGTSFLESNSIIISKGNNSNSWAIVFGGTPSFKYGAKFMYKQGKDILSDVNVVYSDWENSVDDVILKLKKSYPNAYVRSVSGFSKGGLRAYPQVGNYDFVGLIDPSIEGSYTNYNPSGTNTILTWDPRRSWGIKSLKHAMRLLGPNKVIPIKVGHLEQPKEFFSRYKNRL